MVTLFIFLKLFITVVIMSGRGKGGKVKGKSKTRSSRAGLQFPVGRIHRLLRKGTMPRESVLVLPSTWPPLWNIWPLKFSSWLEMLPETTRNPESFPVTCNWPSVMTKNWTNFCPEWPLPRVVSFPTFKLFFCQEDPKGCQVNDARLLQ